MQKAYNYWPFFAYQTCEIPGLRTFGKKSEDDNCQTEVQHPVFHSRV
jgi:hypothetical protein